MGHATRVCKEVQEVGRAEGEGTTNMEDVFTFLWLNVEVDLRGNPWGLGFRNAGSVVQMVGEII